MKPISLMLVIIAFAVSQGAVPKVTMVEKVKQFSFGSDRIEFQCKIESNGPFEAWIEKGGVKISTPFFNTSSTFQYKYEKIRKVDITTEGIYTCLAQNADGTGSANIEIKVTETRQKKLPSTTLAGHIGYYFQIAGNSGEWAKGYTEDVLRNKLAASLAKQLGVAAQRVTTTQVKRKKYSQLIQVINEIKEPDDDSKFLTDNLGAKINKFTESAFLRNLKMDFEIGGTINPVHPTATATLTLAENIGDRCKRASFCPMANTECAPVQLQAGSKRCYCKNGFLDDTEKTCKKRLKATDTRCKACAATEGDCFENDTGIGCKCPMWRSKQGSQIDRCSDEYVKVNCGKEDVVICVKPFDKLIHREFEGFEQDLKNNTNALLYVREDDTACEFQRAGRGNKYCQEGEYMATLRLDDDTERLRCGTTKFKDIPQRHWTSYTNFITARTGKNYVARMGFRCEYDGTGAAKNGHLQLPEIDKLEDKSLTRVRKAEIKLRLLDREHNQLSSNTTVAYGDEIKILVSLARNSEAFQAIRVTNCEASADPNFVYRTELYKDGCPTKGQTFVTKENAFMPLAGDMNRMLTYPKGMKMFRVRPNMNKFYVKCAVKVCQFEIDCKQSACDGGMSVYASNVRHKRAAGEEVNVPLELSLNVKEEGSSVDGVNDGAAKPSGNWVGLAVGGSVGLVGLLLVAIVAVYSVKKLALARSAQNTNSPSGHCNAGYSP